MTFGYCEKYEDTGVFTKYRYMIGGEAQVRDGDDKKEGEEEEEAAAAWFKLLHKCNSNCIRHFKHDACFAAKMQPRLSHLSTD